MVAAGKLRYVVTIEKNSAARTASGAPRQDSWSTVATVRAGISPLSGREAEAAQKIVAEANSKIVMRFVPGIVPEMRVNFFDRRIQATRLFDILNVNDVEEKHMDLVLLCLEHDIKPAGVVISPNPAAAGPSAWGRKNFAEAVDGVRVTFTLPSNPDPNLLQVMRNGQVLTSPQDFTLNGNQVTFATAPKAANGGDPADIIFAYY
jgi:head-tail adaptor